MFWSFSPANEGLIWVLFHLGPSHTILKQFNLAFFNCEIMYNCSICDLSYQSAGGLWTHENTKHKESKKLCAKIVESNFQPRGI